MGQAARLCARQRFFNLVVTNVPGPQFQLYLLGRELRDAFPMVPLAQNQGLGVALMSYNGAINFGLVGDYDILFDLGEVAQDLPTRLRSWLRRRASSSPRRQKSGAPDPVPAPG